MKTGWHFVAAALLPLWVLLISYICRAPLFIKHTAGLGAASLELPLLLSLLPSGYQRLPWEGLDAEARTVGVGAKRVQEAVCCTCMWDAWPLTRNKTASPGYSQPLSTFCLACRKQEALTQLWFNGWVVQLKESYGAGDHNRTKEEFSKAFWVIFHLNASDSKCNTALNTC